MSTIYNTAKKYPIIPKQVLTEHEQCPYIIRTDEKKQPYRDNTEKCSFCGVCSTNYTNGVLVGLYEATLNPMVLIERVECEQVTFDKVEANEDIFLEKGYLLRDGNVYHLVNASTSSIKGQSGSICYKMRSEYDWLDKRCNDCDSCKAIEVFEAICNNNDGFFTTYLGNIHENGEPEFSFEYHEYKCPISLLTEIVVPIYLKEQNIVTQKRSERDIIGVLIIGQHPIGPIPKVELMKKNFPPNMSEEDCDTIFKLRKEIWEKASEEKQTSDSVIDVLNKPVNKRRTSIGKEISVFLEQMRDSVIIRENDYLSVYQSRLINQFLESQSHINASKDNGNLSDSVKQRISSLFRQVYTDFSMSAMHLFFSDLKLTDNPFNPEIKGENIGDTTYLDVMIINIDEFPSPRKYKVDIKTIKEKNCLTWRRLINSKYEIVELDDKRIKNGYYEFYAAISGMNDTKTFFGIFLEWDVIPPKREANAIAHVSFFAALMGVCASEIMACVNLSRSRKLKAFAEETRHDLAQRLQTLDSHNNSFKLDCINYDKITKSTSSDSLFMSQCNTYLQANRELYSALSFLKQSLDDTDLRYHFEPKPFNPYTNFFSQLRQHYNAPWHPLNRRRKLIIGAYNSKEPLRIFVDEAMFRRIIMNLIDNAFKYSPEGTNILLRYYYDAKSSNHIFDIMNFSYGIPEDISKIIFERGVRGNYAAKGEGLGLSVALGFTKKHGGEITISSGIIPSQQNDEHHKPSGLISEIDLTTYYILKDLAERESPKEEVMNMWECVQIERERLLKMVQPNIRQLVDLFGRQNAFNLIMEEQPEDERSRIKPRVGTRDLRDRFSRSIYLTTFSLILPFERRFTYE